MGPPGGNGCGSASGRTGGGAARSPSSGGEAANVQDWTTWDRRPTVRTVGSPNRGHCATVSVGHPPIHRSRRPLHPLGVLLLTCLVSSLAHAEAPELLVSVERVPPSGVEVAVGAPT